MWLRQQLARRVDGSSLGLFRILWGLLMVWEAIRKLPKADGMYSPEYFHFTYALFPFVRPLPEIWMMQTEISVMLIAAVLIAAGWLFRPASALFLLIFTHLFLIEKLYYNNHFYLTILMGFLLMLSEADRCYRLPYPWRWKKSAAQAEISQSIPMWNLVILRAQVIILYFFGGIAKLNSDWLAGEPVRFWFAHKDPNHFLAAFLTQDWFVYMVCWTGLLLDLFAGFTLLSKRTRVVTMLIVIVFHATNSTLFKIGLFPIIGIGLLVLFLDPDRPRKVFSWISVKFGMAKKAVQAPTLSSPQTVGMASWGVTAFVCGWIAFQVVFPLRSITYSDNPSWTEVGHCFSWRMMLRTKDAFMQFKFDPPEAERYLEQHPEMLPQISQAHLRSMVKTPHFILQYAHALGDSLDEAGMKDVEIKCVSIVSLNGRPYQLMIDPDVDLKTVSYGMFEVPNWILPLDEHRRPGQYPDSPLERQETITQVYKEHVQQYKALPDRPAPVKYAADFEYSGTVR